ncbi:hypothetical protein HMPREF0202_02673 [Cetobacterium somerae ATCC BAA-474]|uniref:Uncharacterized protein n=1 Tax=Cetobacterium somerae ATCC BAA-474 TaxID=1319815 RepID=U7V450_9FUSO|nr:hypothetical protein HMPREF0202_02673 [Cetobacterium somerae ATCC BAA-474]
MLRKRLKKKRKITSFSFFSFFNSLFFSFNYYIFINRNGNYII